MLATKQPSVDLVALPIQIVLGFHFCYTIFNQCISCWDLFPIEMILQFVGFDAGQCLMLPWHEIVFIKPEWDRPYEGFWCKIWHARLS